MALAAVLEPLARWLAVTRDPPHRRDVEVTYARLNPADAHLVVQFRLDGATLLVERLVLAGREEAASAVEDELAGMQRELTGRNYG